MRRAIACEPSVLPLSAMMTSPAIPPTRRASCAFRMQVSSVSASFRQGITTDTSIARASASKLRSLPSNSCASLFIFQESPYCLPDSVRPFVGRFGLLALQIELEVAYVKTVPIEELSARRRQLTSLEGGGALAQTGDETEPDDQSKDRKCGNALGGHRGVREGLPYQIDCGDDDDCRDVSQYHPWSG